MLQRIQSIWLLLAGAFTATSFRFPFYSGMLVTKTAPLPYPNTPPVVVAAASSELFAQSSIWLTILTALICGLAFITIFLYGNRKMQSRFTLLGLLLSIGLLAFYFVHLTHFISGVMALSSVFYFAIPVCFILALRGIRADDKLIRSMDRLR
jgi:hypothetical protein